MSVDVIELTKALIRCPSVTPHEAGVLDVLAGALEQIGFRCERHDFSEAGTPDVANLYASWGSGAPHFCFAGHTDVVPPGDEKAWKHGPFDPVVEDGVLYGRGAEDMKGAIAAFVAAAQAVIAHKPPRGTISLLITNDEEGPAINGTRKLCKLLHERGERWDMCLVGEPTNPTELGQMLKIGRRGSINFKLAVHGKQGHAAYPELARNPVTVLVALLHALKSDALDAGTEWFGPSNLEVTSVDVGNAAHNVIPASAHAKFNVRFNPLHSGASVEQWVRKHCDAAGLPYELHTHVTGEAFLNDHAGSAQLVAGAVQRVTAKKPEISTTGGTSDARFIKAYCPVVEFGATGSTIHMVNEHVAVETLHQLARVYEAILSDFFSQ